MTQGNGPPAAGRSWQQGLTRFEFLVTVVIIAVLIGVFLHRSATLQGRIEAHVVRSDVEAMRTAVTLARARGEAIQEGGNPVEWLGDAARYDSGPVRGSFQDRYQGSVTARDYDSVIPGHWGFMTDEGWLVYRVANPRSIARPLRPDPPHVRVRVRGAPAEPGLMVEPGGEGSRNR